MHRRSHSADGIVQHIVHHDSEPGQAFPQVIGQRNHSHSEVNQVHVSGSLPPFASIQRPSLSPLPPLPQGLPPPPTQSQEDLRSGMKLEGLQPAVPSSSRSLHDPLLPPRGHYSDVLPSNVVTDGLDGVGKCSYYFLSAFIYFSIYSSPFIYLNHFS